MEGAGGSRSRSNGREAIDLEPPVRCYCGYGFLRCLMPLEEAWPDKQNCHGLKIQAYQPNRARQALAIIFWKFMNQLQPNGVIEGGTGGTNKAWTATHTNASPWPFVSALRFVIKHFAQLAWSCSDSGGAPVERFDGLQMLQIDPSRVIYYI